MKDLKIKKEKEGGRLQGSLMRVEFPEKLPGLMEQKNKEKNLLSSISAKTLTS